MPTEDEYGERAKRLLRAEMVRRGVSYEALSEKLGALGLHDTPVNLRNKVSRGKFTAAFLFAVCEAIGADTMRFCE
jgi:hypothetical protein